MRIESCKVRNMVATRSKSFSGFFSALEALAIDISHLDTFFLTS